VNVAVLKSDQDLVVDLRQANETLILYQPARGT
jgi:hypothetical protein